MGEALDELLRAAAGDERVIGFAGGLPCPALFPRRELTSAFLRALQTRDVPALQYAWPEGFPALRQHIAERLVRRGVTVGADEIIVTSGAQQAITIAAQLVLRRGAAIGVDAETYPSALDAFRTLHLVPTTNPQARVLYRMPAVSNPGGATMSDSERRAALAHARFIIEDDAYGDLRFLAEPPAPLLAASRAHVLYVGTFSKTLGPGLRVGFLIVPPRLHARALRRKADDDLQTNSLSQAIVQEYLAHNDFDAFVGKLRRQYRRRADRLMAAVARHLPGWSFTPPSGGFGLWVSADARVDEAAFLRRSIAAGVSFDPGSRFLTEPAPRDRPTTLRLCFSAVPEEAIEEGARRLAEAWAAARRRRSRPGETGPRRLPQRLALRARERTLPRERRNP